MEVWNGAPTPLEVLEPLNISLIVTHSNKTVPKNTTRTQGRFIPQVVLQHDVQNKKPKQLTQLTYLRYCFQSTFCSRHHTHKQSTFLVFDKCCWNPFAGSNRPPTSKINRKHNCMTEKQGAEIYVHVKGTRYRLSTLAKKIPDNRTKCPKKKVKGKRCRCDLLESDWTLYM